jgi:hypothetical protein
LDIPEGIRSDHSSQGASEALTIVLYVHQFVQILDHASIKPIKLRAFLLQQLWIT